MLRRVVDQKMISYPHLLDRWRRQHPSHQKLSDVLRNTGKNSGATNKQTATLICLKWASINIVNNNNC